MLGTQWFEERAALFGWMANRHDVDWSRTAGLSGALAVRNAVHTCLACRSAEACAAAYESGSGPAEALDFCPNRRLFAAWSRSALPQG